MEFFKELSVPTITNLIIIVSAGSGFVAAYYYNRVVHSLGVFFFCLGLLFMVVSRSGGIILNTPADAMFYIRALSALCFPISMWIIIWDTKNYINRNGFKIAQTRMEEKIDVLVKDVGSPSKVEKSQERSEANQGNLKDGQNRIETKQEKTVHSQEREEIAQLSIKKAQIKLGEVVLRIEKKVDKLIKK